MQNKFSEKNNLWQTPAWKNFQIQLGREAWFLENENWQAVIIKHKLPFGYSWFDLPRGPIGKKINLKTILSQIFSKTESKKVVFVRIMPFEKPEQADLHFKIKQAHNNHQPETTLKLDLTLSEENILAQMKPKGRYNIHLAKKRGVRVFSSQEVEKFYQLIQETTQRNHFSGHGLEYYQTLLKSFPKNSQLYLAEYLGKIIAGGIFIFTDTEAVYYYGASSNSFREVMAPYLIQWTAIQEARHKGCHTYDFLGIAPVNADKNHPWQGVTDFKLKFGGEIVNYPPAQEIILKPWIYFLFVLLKKIRNRLN